MGREAPEVRIRPIASQPAEAQLETGGAVVRDREGAFERDAGGAQSSFFEEPADERDAGRYTAGRVEFGKRGFGIGCSVAAGFGNVEKSSTHLEGKIAGKILHSYEFVTHRQRALY